MQLRRAAVQLAFVATIGGGCREITTTNAPLVQRGYLWNRVWNSAVKDAAVEAQNNLDGVIVLGGEIITTGGAPRLIKASLDWSVFARQKQCAIALRVAPSAASSQLGEFASASAKELVDDAQKAGAKITEFQLDFDCPQGKLAEYAKWLPIIRAAVAPARFVITTLPSWLGSRDFRRLVSETDAFVLQVHSVPLRNTLAPTLCDRAAALRWIGQAARIGKPFAVALPTYRCLAGYDASGRLIDVAMDSVQPSFPAGTRVLEMSANADEIAALVATLRAAHPASLTELIWYRVPTPVDERNWKWSTLRAVMSGRPPARQLDLERNGENPIDVVLANDGEADELVEKSVAVRADRAIIAADALPGWRVAAESSRAIFSPAGDRIVRLSPGERRVIGWLRYDAPAHAEMRFEPNAAR